MSDGVAEIEIRLPECPYCGDSNIKTYAVKKRGALRLYHCTSCFRSFRARVLNPRTTRRRENPSNGPVANNSNS